LVSEIQPDPAPGRTTYRKQLALSFFYKFYLSLQPTLPSYLKVKKTNKHTNIQT